MRKYQITNHATKKKIIVEANSAQEAAKKVGCRIKGIEVTDIGQPKLSGITIEKAIMMNDREAETQQAKQERWETRKQARANESSHGHWYEIIGPTGEVVGHGWLPDAGYNETGMYETIRR